MTATDRVQRGAPCPVYGHPIVPRGLHFPVRRRPGITAEQLRETVWAHDVNGGPEYRKVLHVHIHRLNRLLARAASLREPITQARALNRPHITTAHIDLKEKLS